MPQPNVSNAALQSDIQRLEEKLDKIIGELPRTYVNALSFDKLEARVVLNADKVDRLNAENVTWANAAFSRMREELVAETRKTHEEINKLQISWYQARIAFFAQLVALIVIPLAFLVINHYWVK